MAVRGRALWRLSWALVGVLGMVLVVSCSASPKDQEPVGQDGTTGPSTSVSPRPGSPGMTVEPGARPASGLSTSPTTAGTAGSTGAPSDAGQAPAKFLSGRFTYTEVSTLDNPNGEPFDARGEWSIRAEPRRGDTQVITYYQGKEENKNDQVDRWAWRDGRRELVSRGGTARGTCQWQPAILDLKLPVVAGSSWTGKSSCITDEQKTAA